MSTHGLSYPPHFLSHLPVIHPRPHPHTPIRLLSAHQFASIHLNHLLAHAPDNVLFPFLHGLEGSNHAQNLFFANNTHKSGQTFKDIRVPNFRGLVWVVCDDDLPVDHQTECDEDEELDDESFSDASSSCLVDPDRLAMDVDPDHNNNTDPPQNTPSPEGNSGPSHMHPVSLRHKQLPLVAPAPIHTPISSTPSDTPRRDSTASSTCSVATSTDSCLTSANASLSSPATSVASSNLPDKHAPSAPLSSSPSPPPSSSSPLIPPRSQTTSPSPILTSTFYPRDLLRANSEGEPEFIPPIVPSGISLRNFGIQVPIYATISDIVIYSPKGLTSNAIALAETFKTAVEKQAMERLSRLGKCIGSPSSASSYSDPSADNALTPREDSCAEMAPEKIELESSGLLAYNVFVLSATADEMHKVFPDLIIRHAHCPSPPSTATTTTTDPPPLIPNTVNFAQRERDEMRDLTKASEIISAYPSKEAEDQARAKAKAEGIDMSRTATYWDPRLGQVFLGNSNDVPMAVEGLSPAYASFNYVDVAADVDINMEEDKSKDEGKCHPSSALADADPFNYITNDPALGLGYDICIECTDFAPFPSAAHLRAAEEHLQMLDTAWVERCRNQRRRSRQGGYANNAHGENECEIPIRPPPNANAVIHLPFPSSPLSCTMTVNAIVPVVKFLERVLQIPSPRLHMPSLPLPPASAPPRPSAGSGSRRWSSAASPLPPGPTLSLSASYPTSALPPPPFRTRSFTSLPPNPHGTLSRRTRPLKILIYSSDGYTESSVAALCLLMAVRGLSLPEAYLELQVVKKRSFFVHQADLGVLRRVEAKFHGSGDAGGGGGGSEEEYRGTRMQNPYKRPAANSVSCTQSPYSQSYSFQSLSQSQSAVSPSHAYLTHSRSHSLSESESESASPSPPPSPPATMMVVPSQTHHKSRPRASTSPWLPSLFGDHQAWFNDPRFDGSFPSRVLPFLYLGNLNHASNAYMLHALGITHVVSVGECALVPPPHINASCPFIPSATTTANTTCSTQEYGNTGPHFIAGKGPGHQGSLWIEEREGRIKVLDIKGVCDDGIDTLEPQLEPICAWIEKARMDGGQVLVHCRVGVSRSATVTIAYVMKHLGLPLVDAYLIVRSRRLSVLIQPNMRLLYNLCGWEVKLARERAGEDEENLRVELSRALSWPYLAKEVHALNEKYLH